jgi:site-specific DNA recombinase
MPRIRKVMPEYAQETRSIRVAAYARVSSGKDAMLHSLAAQIDYYRNYIQGHSGWAIAGVYSDEAVTGTRDDRPEFQKLLRDCRNGQIDMVVTKAVSRFARNTVTLLETTRELKALGIPVFFEKEGLYSDRGQGEMVLTLLASVAQEESRATSENCKWRIQSRFKAGELANLNFMYGYRISRGRIDIAPDEAAVVIRVFGDYLAGAGTKAIARSLKEQQAPTPRGGQWTANRVMRLLKNEKYAGNALLQKKYVRDHITKKEVINHGQKAQYFAAGTHPAIIAPEVFRQVQQQIEANRARDHITGRATAKYPFTGKITCGHCGKSYTRIIRAGTAKWQCATYLAEGRGACPAKQIPEDTLLSLTAGVLGLQEFDPAAFSAQVMKMNVTAPNTVRFVFCGGHEAEADWQDRSRAGSWTEEMKMQAPVLSFWNVSLQKPVLWNEVPAIIKKSF